MSFPDNELFLEPKTNQYGSHMIMTNVNKPTKTKFINIDTKFRDEYNYNDGSYYNITLPERYKYNITMPERITSVKTITVKSVEIPMTFYNISANLGNNQISITNNSTNITSTITVPDGYYLSDGGATNSLISAINSLLSGKYITFTNDNNNCKFTGTSTRTANTYTVYTISFPYQDKYTFKSSLGWILGFRVSSFTLIPENPVIASCPILLSQPYPRYLYLSVDEYSKGVQNSFVTPISNAFLTKNVLARVTLDPLGYPYGSVLIATDRNGLLVSDHRSYNGKVDLQKFNIQLFNETGMPIDLNGQDFSFCLEITYE